MAFLSPNDEELVTFNYIRSEYENKYKQNVPMALKYLTTQFSKRIIGCNLLTIKQDLDFFKLLSTKLPSIHRFDLLFRASDHQYSADKFHEHCDHKPGTITIIKSNWGNIFGGYTSKSWWKLQRLRYIRDENAFLYVIKSDDISIKNNCPLLLELRKDDIDRAICCHTYFGPRFGDDILIRDNCNQKHENAACQNSYKNNDIPMVNLCGGNVINEYGEQLFEVIDYQVFQIIRRD